MADAIEADGDVARGNATGRTVALIGTGLIGGSIAAAMRERDPTARIIGVGAEEHTRIALERGWIDAAGSTIADAVRQARQVVLAVPGRALPSVLAECAPVLAADGVITDCTSTKRAPIEAARRALGPRFDRFVPGHPIAGSEHSGPQAARADLFVGAITILCPQPQTADDAMAAIDAWWRSLGARTTRMDADEHDRLFAEVSHWPHAVAFALAAAIAEAPWARDAARYAGAGLRDTTRIAASSPDMWADILLENRDAVLACAARTQAEIERLVQAIREGDRDALRERFDAGSRWRRSVRPSEG